MRKMRLISKGAMAAALMIMAQGAGAREFVHPGLSYTDDDLCRMRELIAKGAEPATTTFEALKSSAYSQVTGGDFADITVIPNGQHNNTIGVDGRKAHDLALLYRLTDDRRFADEALKHINRYNNLTNVSIRGTGPLDGGKIYLLIEAAELLRDYEGWKESDREAFRRMLVHPGYSMTEYPSEHADMDDELNDVTFYWNIYNFDPSRWGNQGLFAARGLMAMAIFLDNEAMYDRVMHYLTARNAPEGDLPYHTGAPVRGRLNSETEYLADYSFSWQDGTEQFVSDAAIPYYIYANGQCQEACRDQGHVMAGLGQLVDLAEMAWNQGDDLYGAYDNRILLGLEWALRYNLSFLTGNAWKPADYSYMESECTFDNGLFYRADSRSQRWSAKWVYDLDRESSLSNVRYLQQALAHYRDRAHVDAGKYEWLRKACEYQLENETIENWGRSGHHYEWKGWGTLTKAREQKYSGIATPTADTEDADGPVFDLWGRRSSAHSTGLKVKNGVKYINRRTEE